MKRLQIYIEADIDDALTRRARRERRSKAALVREAVRQSLGEQGPVEDPFRSWIGGSEADPAPVDDIVYES